LDFMYYNCKMQGTNESSGVRPHYYELDLMRFIAAFIILLYHYTYSTFLVLGAPAFGIEKVTRYGYLGVDIFFMISGYVVLMSSMHKSPQDFLVSRISRLYPAYWLTVILSFIVVYFVDPAGVNAPKPTFQLLVYNLTMLQNFFGKESINPVFWTLTFEISFYFLILIIAGLRLWKNLLLIVAAWLLYSLIAGLHSADTPFAYLLIPKYSCCFIAGMLFYMIRINYTNRWKIYTLLLACFILNVRNDLLIRVEVGNLSHNPSGIKGPVMLVAVTAFYLFFFLSSNGRLSRLNFKLFSQLGALTYPLYLLHPAGCYVLFALAGKIDKYLLLVIVTLFFLVVAYLTNKFIEKKLQTVLKVKLRTWANRLK